MLERFLGYVRVDTKSNRDGEGSPSTPGQLELARVLVAELEDAGLADASIDDHGYVTARLEPTLDGPLPTICFIAHVDTSPEESGAGVEPVVHEGYSGEQLELGRNGAALDPSDNPELAAAVGDDIVTTSGDTLLGADDKAGVAEIMAAVAHLAANPELPRPDVRVCFTPDEEIGSGASLLDLEELGADCAYTLDGSAPGEIQDETFNAAEVIVTITGVEAHPGFATGVMVNALRLVGRVLAELPPELSPERTADRDGFIHPYELEGTAARATLRAIVRDFDERLLREYCELLRATAARVCESEQRATLELEVVDQYPNMRRFIESFPLVSAAAEEAIRGEGLEPVRKPIRGGTDGSLLSARGLPTPNIFTGGHDYHSVREWASVQQMASAAAVVVRLAEVWTRSEFRGAFE